MVINPLMPNGAEGFTNNILCFQNCVLRFYVVLNRWKTHILLKSALVGCLWVTCGRSLKEQTNIDKLTELTRHCSNFY